MKVLVKGNLLVKEQVGVIEDADYGTNISYNLGEMSGDYDMVIKGDLKAESLTVYLGELHVEGDIIITG